MNKKFVKTGSNLLCFMLGGIFSYFYEKRRDQNSKDTGKDRKARQLLDNWLVLTEHGIKIEEYFHKKNIHTTAVYGYGDIGNHLVAQLMGTDIEVKYIIDRRPCNTPGGIKWCSPSEQFSDVDAVVVTPVWEYSKIAEILQSKVSGQIISVEDIVYELL